MSGGVPERSVTIVPDAATGEPVCRHGRPETAIVDRMDRRDVMRTPRAVLVAALCIGLASCAARPPSSSSISLREQVVAAERAFAASMARRDLAAFAGFVDEEAVFFGEEEPLRGRDRIVQAWSRFFEGTIAPFSWEPDQVEVLPSGTLAFSSGPVRAPGGAVVARFNSIWRLQSPGVWKVVFDKGSPLPAPPRRP